MWERQWEDREMKFSPNQPWRQPAMSVKHHSTAHSTIVLFLFCRTYHRPRYPQAFHRGPSSGPQGRDSQGCPQSLPDHKWKQKNEVDFILQIRVCIEGGLFDNKSMVILWVNSRKLSRKLENQPSSKGIAPGKSTDTKTSLLTACGSICLFTMATLV